MNTWYTIKALAADGNAASDTTPATRASISIHDQIGHWGVTAKDFIAEFNALPAGIPIELSIHSPGGDVFEALAMYHVLLGARERITAKVVGLAASAATLPLMATGKRVAPANAYVMVHHPMTGSWGNAQEMREVAEFLEKITGSLVNIYATHSGGDQAAIRAMMDAETWLDGQAAANAGFIDEVLDALPVAASLSAHAASRFANVPKALLAAPAPEPAPVADHSVDANEKVSAPAAPAGDHVPDAGNMVCAMPADAIAAQCLAAGEAALAPLLIRAQVDEDTLTRRLQDAREIRAIAAAAGRADEAQALILAGHSVTHARTQLLAARASELPRIHTHARSDGDAYDNQPGALNHALDTREIYSRRKASPSSALPA